jgi:hypothetical protein
MDSPVIVTVGISAFFKACLRTSGLGDPLARRGDELLPQGRDHRGPRDPVMIARYT